MTVVFGSPAESVRIGKVVLVSAPKLVACEVATTGTTGGAVLAATVELASDPGLVTIESVLSDLLWEALGIVLEKIGLAFAG